MKKIFTYLLAFAAVTTVISCSKSDGSDEPVQEPTITWPSNLNSDKVDISDGMEVKIKVDVPAGIKTFKIVVESGVLNENGITEIDLIEPSKVAAISAVANRTDITKSTQITLEDIVKMILGEGGSPKDKTSYTLDLTKLVLWINEHTIEERDHKFTVTVGDKNNKTASKTLTFHRVALPAPTITWESNPNFEKKNITDEMDVKIKIDAPAGIKTFKVAVESNVLNKMEINEIDLIESGETMETIVEMILGEAGSPKDKTEYSLDLSNLVPKINGLTSEESDHTFTLTVGDNNDKETKRTAVFHRVSMDITETAVTGVEFEMVYVRGGMFTMGATEEQDMNKYNRAYPPHSVTLSDYHIGKYEVTQGLWKAVMGSDNNPSRFKKGDDYPVERVNWDDIQNFLKELNRLTGKNYALPTEAQWEYAARGGEKTKNYKYSGSDNIKDVAWYTDNCEESNDVEPRRSTHPVGTKKPNELGLYDMSGNVYEWCNDWYGAYSSDSQTDPKGPITGNRRMLRGGSWISKEKDSQVANRDTDLRPETNDFICGFRLVLLPKD